MHDIMTFGAREGEYIGDLHGLISGDKVPMVEVKMTDSQSFSSRKRIETTFYI